MADEAGDDDDGQGEFTTKVKRSDRKKEKDIPVWRRGAKTYVYRSEVFTQWAAERWNLYFETITGKRMGFEFTPRTLPYVSALECRRNLDVLLIPLMPKRPVIWDLTAGSGSDFVGFALFYNFAKYHGVDFMHDKDFTIFHKNVTKFTNVYPADYPPGCIAVSGEGRDTWNDPNVKIRLQNSSAKKFIGEYGRYVTTKMEYNLVDCVYVDPSWSGDYLTKSLDDDQYKEWVAQDVNEGESLPISIEHEASPAIVMNWVVNEILTPMNAAKPPIKCALLVLKVRFQLTSVTMQTYLTNSKIGQNFVVLYAVQALPNIPQTDIDEENGHKIIMDHIHGKKVKRPVTKENGVNMVKGQFHWLVLKNTDYTYVDDLKAKWYDNEMLIGKPQPVYVLDGSTMKTTFKPTYSDKLPCPTVKTEREWMRMDDKQQQALYHKVGPVRARREVTELDISTYIEDLGKLQHDLEVAQSTNRYDIKEIVGKIKSILVASIMYDEEIFDKYASVIPLRSIMKTMQAVVTRYEEGIDRTKQQEKIENKTDSEKQGDIEPRIPKTKAWTKWVERRKGRSTAKGEFPTDLGALLQALQGLAAR
jgi:hypothetical protein